MTASKNHNRPKWRPTPDELASMRSDYADTQTRELAARFGRQYHQVAKLAERLRLKKSAAFLAGPSGGRTDGTIGVSGRFKPGHVPWTLGKKLPGHGGPTTFKVGHRTHNYLPLGSYRIGSGYLQRKTSETGYPPKDWSMVHRLVWEAAHGPIPDGCVVTFKPGMRTTVLEQITVDVLEIASRVDLMKRNSITNVPPELAEVMRLRGVITKTINRTKKAPA